MFIACTSGFQYHKRFVEYPAQLDDFLAILCFNFC